jgi:hypothetical protein
MFRAKTVRLELPSDYPYIFQLVAPYTNESLFILLALPTLVQTVL